MNEQQAQPTLGGSAGSVHLYRAYYFSFLLSVAYSVLPVLAFWGLSAVTGGASAASRALPYTFSEAVRLTVMIVFFVVFYYTGKRPELWQDVGFSAVLVYAGVALGGLAGFVGITTATTLSGTVLSSSLSFSFTVEDLPSLLVEATYGFGLLFGAAAIASTRTLWPSGSIDNKASIRTAALASFLVFSSFIVTSIALWLFFRVQLPTGLLPIELAQLAGYLVLPVLFLAVLYLSGKRAYLLNGYARLLAYLLVGCVVGSILGTFAQGYLESLVFVGFNLASFFSWESLGFAVEQGVVASLLGFSAVYLGESRRRSSGMASISEFTTGGAANPW